MKIEELNCWFGRRGDNDILMLLSGLGVTLESLGGRSLSVWRDEEILQATDDPDIKFLSKRDGLVFARR